MLYLIVSARWQKILREQFKSPINFVAGGGLGSLFDISNFLAIGVFLQAVVSWKLYLHPRRQNDFQRFRLRLSYNLCGQHIDTSSQNT